MVNWQNIVLSQANTIQNAIEILNKAALRIVLVVDNDGRLIGTVTDGDIRRALINHMSLDIPLSKIMFKEPTFATQGESREAILAKMKKLDLLQIPILDSDRKIIGLETLHQDEQLTEYYA